MRITQLLPHGIVVFVLPDSLHQLTTNLIIQLHELSEFRCGCSIVHAYGNSTRSQLPFLKTLTQIRFFTYDQTKFCNKYKWYTVLCLKTKRNIIPWYRSNVVSVYSNFIVAKLCGVLHLQSYGVELMFPINFDNSWPQAH